MGKLLAGRYGSAPDAESGTLTLRECSQMLGLKPSDFVSGGAPAFFEKTFGAKGRYLLFLVEPEETAGSPIWKPGYYLLPLDAADVLETLNRSRSRTDSLDGGSRRLPVDITFKQEPPALVLDRAKQWADESQPLFFSCRCKELEMQLTAPWSLRKRWKARLRCPGRCVPALQTLL